VHLRTDTAQGVVQSVVLCACTCDSARVHTCVLARLHLCARLCISVCVCAFLTAGMQHPVCCCVVTSACTCVCVHNTVLVAAWCWVVAQMHTRADSAQLPVLSVVMCARLCKRERCMCALVTVFHAHMCEPQWMSAPTLVLNNSFRVHYTPFPAEMMQC
jgi:hypothetical protein